MLRFHSFETSQLSQLAHNHRNGSLMGRKTQTIQSELVGTKPCSAANTPAHETIDDEETFHVKILAIQWRYICAVLSGDQPQRNAPQAEQEKSI